MKNLIEKFLIIIRMDNQKTINFKKLMMIINNKLFKKSKYKSSNGVNQIFNQNQKKLMIKHYKSLC